MSDYKGIGYLRRKLATKKSRINLRYKFYEQKNTVRYFSKLLPTEHQFQNHHLGWCTKSVDSLADRLTVNKFRNDNFYMNEIYQLNNPDVLYSSAITSALITGCSFLYISEKDGYPAIEVVDGGHATGILDDVTHMLTEGYAVLAFDERDKPLLEAYFTPGETTYYPVGGQPYTVPNSAPYPLLVPIIHRPDAKKPFGHSRITRACMKAQEDADGVLTLASVAAEYYAIPQKYAIGLSEDVEFNGTAADYSRFLAFYKDEDGDKPQLGQFNQSSMAPFVEQFKMYASIFGGETGLTLDDLGFMTGNPSSADAIKSQHENLRLSALKAQDSFGTGFINAGYLAACVRDGKPYARKEVYETKLAWKPIFGIDASMMSTFGDGLLKIQQAYPDYMTEEKLDDLLGL